MRISLNGYYGFANYGDELFILASVLGARRWWPSHQVEVLGPPVAGVEATYCVPRWFPQSLYTSASIVGKVARLVFFANGMLRCDLILHAGGSTLTSARTVRKKIERFAAKRGMTQFAAIGVSVGPFDGEGELAAAANLLRRFIYFSVRDRPSQELLAHMRVPTKVVLGRDLAGVLPLLLPAADARTPAERQVLGVSLAGVGSVQTGVLIEGIMHFSKRTGILVRCFCLNCHPVFGDAEISTVLQERLQQEGVLSERVDANHSLIGCWHSLASCRAVFSVRLHGSVTAYLHGVPTALVEYHRKCTDFLDDIGQPALLRIGAACTDAGEVERLLERLFEHPPMPTVPCAEYAREAALSFTEAPWAARE